MMPSVARMPTTTTTMSSSIRVKPCRWDDRISLSLENRGSDPNHYGGGTARHRPRRTRSIGFSLIQPACGKQLRLLTRAGDHARLGGRRRAARGRVVVLEHAALLRGRVEGVVRRGRVPLRVVRADGDRDVRAVRLREVERSRVVAVLV